MCRGAWLLAMVSVFFLARSPTDARPAVHVLDISAAKPVRTKPEMIGRAARVRGWFRPGVLLLPVRRGTEHGFRVIRPFAFVREKNPSLGWPSWWALDVILVDAGWIPAAEGRVRPPLESYPDPLFVAPVTVHGFVRRPPSDLTRMRRHFVGLAPATGLEPVGRRVLPILIELAHGRGDHRAY